MSQKRSIARSGLLWGVACMLALVCVFFSGCSGEQSEQTEQPTEPAYMTELIDSGALKVLVALDYPPYSAGEVESAWGYDIAVARELAARLSLGLELVPVQRDKIIDVLAEEPSDSATDSATTATTKQDSADADAQGANSASSANGGADSTTGTNSPAASNASSATAEQEADKPVGDIAIAALAITPERDDKVDFSSWYSVGSQAVVTLKGTYRGTTEFDREKTRIAVVKGSTCLQTAKSLTSEKLVVEYSTAQKCLQAIQAKEVKAAVLDLPVATYLINNGFSDMRILESVMTGEAYGIAIPSDSPELKNAINEALAQMEEDGTLDRLREQFGL